MTEFLRAQELRAEPVISDATAAALLDGLGDFTTSDKVRLFLQRITEQIVRRRVGRRDAVTIAYLCQLILNCQGMTFRQVRDATAYLEASNPKPKTEIIWDWKVNRDADQSSQQNESESSDETEDS